MHYLNYKEHKNIRNDVEPLFISAFPVEERPTPEIYFRNFDMRKENVLLGFYEEEKFIGFASYILYKDICYLFFLAVKDEYRNKGYGSKILEETKKLYSDYTILLCYEEVDRKYEDYEMRLRRSFFYKKNGFVINPLKTYEFGVVFQTVYCGHRTVTFEEYKNIFMTGFGLKDDEFLKNNLKEIK